MSDKFESIKRDLEHLSRKLPDLSCNEDIQDYLGRRGQKQKHMNIGQGLKEHEPPMYDVREANILTHLYTLNRAECDCLALAEKENDAVIKDHPQNVIAHFNRVRICVAKKSNIAKANESLSILKGFGAGDPMTCQDKKLQLLLAQANVALLHYKIGPVFYRKAVNLYEQVLAGLQELQGGGLDVTDYEVVYRYDVAHVYSTLLNKGNIVQYSDTEDDPLDENSIFPKIKEHLNTVIERWPQTKLASCAAGSEGGQSRINLRARAYIELADAKKKYETAGDHRKHTDDLDPNDLIPKALAEGEMDPHVLERCGRHYSQKGASREDFDEAIKLLERCVQLNPSRHVAYHQLCLAYKKAWVDGTGAKKKTLWANKHRTKPKQKKNKSNRSKCPFLDVFPKSQNGACQNAGVPGESNQSAAHSARKDTSSCPEPSRPMDNLEMSDKLSQLPTVADGDVVEKREEKPSSAASAGAQCLTSAPADSGAGAQCLTSAPADSGAGAQCLTSAPADSGAGAHCLTSAPADSGAGAHCLTSAPAEPGCDSGAANADTDIIYARNGNGANNLCLANKFPVLHQRKPKDINKEAKIYRRPEYFDEFRVINPCLEDGEPGQQELMEKAKQSMLKAIHLVAETSSRYWTELGRLNEIFGDRDGAIDCYIKAVGDDMMVTHNDAAFAYEQRGLLEQQKLKNTILSETEEEKKYDDLKNFYRDSVRSAVLGKQRSRVAFHKLKEILTKQIKTHTGDILLKKELAALHKMGNQWTRAEEVLMDAWGNDDSTGNIDTVLELIEVFAKQEKYREACRYLDIIAKKNKRKIMDDAEKGDMLVKLVSKLGDCEVRPHKQTMKNMFQWVAPKKSAYAQRVAPKKRVGDVFLFASGKETKLIGNLRMALKEPADLKVQGAIIDESYQAWSELYQTEGSIFDADQRAVDTALRARSWIFICDKNAPILRGDSDTRDATEDPTSGSEQDSNADSDEESDSERETHNQGGNDHDQSECSCWTGDGRLKALVECLFSACRKAPKEQQPRMCYICACADDHVARAPFADPARRLKIDDALLEKLKSPDDELMQAADKWRLHCSLMECFWQDSLPNN